MPKLFQGDTETANTGANRFAYSRVGFDKLTAAQYTLASLIVDKSSSVYAFEKELNEMVRVVAETCLKSPRARNLLYRLGAFGSDIEELHGFTLLDLVDVAKYAGVIVPGGMTDLYGATLEMIETSASFAGDMWDNDYEINGIGFVVTDGDDTAHNHNVDVIKTAVDQLRATEKMVDWKMVLIGIDKDAPANFDPNSSVADTALNHYLAQYQIDAGFDAFINIGRASPDTLARVAEFITSSISSQSDDIANGTKSAVLNY